MAMTRLKRAATLRAGGTPTVDDPEMWQEDGTPWVAIADMTRSALVVSTERRVSKAGVVSKRLPIGTPGTTLFAMYASVGALGVLGTPASWNQAILGIKSRPALSDDRFLRYWLEHLRPSLGALTRNNTQDNLNAEQVGNFPFPVLPVTSQRAIADFLDTETGRIDALIGTKRRVIDLLDERFEAAVFHGITRGLNDDQHLRPSGLSWVAEIPESWGTPTVAANFDLQLGKMLSAEAASGPEQYPYVRNVNVQWDRFVMDDLATMHFSEQDRRRCELRPGDLLVCEGGEVGRAAVWNNEMSNCYFQKAIHRVRPRRGANSRFLMYCLRAAARRSVFAVEGNLSTIVHLTGEQLRVHRFPWPSQEEQAEIVGHLDRLALQVERTRSQMGRQLELLVEHRQALITAAVTGEFAVPGVAA